MMKTETIKINVAEFYRPELMKYLPEDMFDLLDEAHYYRKVNIRISFALFTEYLKLNPHEKDYNIIIHPN